MTIEVSTSLSSTPRYIYQPEGQQFILSPDPASSLPAGHRRGEMYRERLHFVQHLLLKGENFVRIENYQPSSSASVPAAESLILPRISGETLEEIGNMVPRKPHELSLFAISEGEKFPLTPVESLPGSKGTAFSLGFLIQPEEGKFALEGLSLSVRLDLTHAEFSDDMITLHTLIVVKGKMDGNIFRVSEMSFPPIAKREHFEILGNREIVARQQKNRSILARARDGPSQPAPSQDPGQTGLALIFSDCNLEKSGTLEKLQNVLAGFAGVGQTPDVVVLMGSFVGHPVGVTSEELRRYQRAFSSLIDFIAKNVDILRASELVLVPGPMDPGQEMLLPRFPIDKIRSFDICERAKALGVKVVLGTNPCRVKIGRGPGVRDLVVFREELTHTLEQNRIKHTSQVDFDLTAQCILSQLHLYPLPCLSKTAKPVMWDYDAVLRLQPIPHAVVVGEGAGPGLELTLNGCSVARAPSFAESGEFLVYYGEKLELSQAQ